MAVTATERIDGGDVGSSEDCEAAGQPRPAGQDLGRVRNPADQTEWTCDRVQAERAGNNRVRRRGSMSRGEWHGLAWHCSWPMKQDFGRGKVEDQSEEVKIEV